MFIVVGRPHSIADLNGHFDLNIGKMRTNTEICIIDDEVFPKSNTLTQHGYRIKELGDISDINATAAYPVVLCDIRGVGKRFGSEFEGGHIIEEINKYFPAKVIIAYTGERLDPRFNRFFSIADDTVKKDATDDQWVERLDEAIRIVHSPIAQWSKIRRRLLDLSISSIDLVRIEDIYVQSYLSKSNQFVNNKLVERMNPEVKAVLLNLVSSFIFLAVVGR